MSTEIVELGNDIPVFNGLTSDEIKLLASAATQVEKKAGEVIFKEGEPGGDLQVIISGKVKITKKILAEVDRTMLTLQRGGVFGELSVISGDSRTASAIAVTDTLLLSVNRESFCKVTEENPELGRKLHLNLLKIVGSRLQTTTELYRQAAGWGLEISGAVKLNYSQLIADHVNITLELLSGNKISGQLLKADHNESGVEMMVKTDDERIVIVPFHAVSEISFSSRQPASSKDN